MLKALVDGLPAQTVPLDDRGFQYGHGVFETLAVVDGTPLLWGEHYARLSAACAQLQIAVPPESLLRAEAATICAEQQSAVLKIVITAGSGGRGYRSPPSGVTRRIVSLWPWPEYPSQYAREGIALFECRTPAAAHAALGGFKHLHCIDRVLAHAEWQDDYAEGVMCNAAGEIVSGTMSNLFLVVGRRIDTPALVDSGVRGIMRAQVRQAASQLRIECRECILKIDDLIHADAAFITNSLIGLWPVKQFKQRSYSIGEITRSIQKKIAAVCAPHRE